MFTLAASGTIYASHYITIVSGTYLERFKPAVTKSKETPGEENPKILKSGFDWTKMLGRGGLISEIAEVPRTKGTQKHGSTFWFFARRA